MPTRNYPCLPGAASGNEDDIESEALDAKSLRARLAARDAAAERFRRLKEKLLAARGDEATKG